MFVEIQHNYSSGKGEWEVLEGDFSSLSSAQEMWGHGKYECDEHCRGTVVRALETLPREVIEKWIKEHKEKAEYHQSLIEKYKEMLKGSEG